MFRLRQEQLNRFATHDEGALIQLIAEYLLEHKASLVDTLHPPALRRMILGGIRRARTHGLEHPEAVLGFVVLMFAVAPNFDQHPELRFGLRDTRVPEHDRVNELLRTAPPNAWKQAEDRYDRDAWWAFDGDPLAQIRARLLAEEEGS